MKHHMMSSYRIPIYYTVIMFDAPILAATASTCLYLLQKPLPRDKTTINCDIIDQNVSETS